MKHIVEFYQNNKELCQLIAYVLVSVISTIVLCLIKKKKVVNDMDLILKEVFERLPGLINDAEPFKGAELKKSLVMEGVKKFVLDRFSLTLPDSVLSLISDMVEKILSTPHAKEKE